MQHPASLKRGEKKMADPFEVPDADYTVLRHVNEFLDAVSR